MVGAPEEFIKQRKNIVAVFTDQVPIWLARSSRSRRTFFANHENVKNSKTGVIYVGEVYTAGHSFHVDAV